ncbi:unnamed protein product [Acanthoscelides obtectus]|uniref:Cilia- and flagella-associated protein 91 n=1 Tax=Acanthoscelides obtectus TaxID=200917 RepID=A0A9P0QBV2_ACAOB|nr:unnamed protein product [Acanthoscelides obtectus]
MASARCMPFRPHDFMYDPIFTVSGPADHYKAAIAAKMSTAKFQICPIFPNMFSDLPSRPRVQYVRRRPTLKAPPPFKRRLPSEPTDPRLQRQPDVLGKDRLKFFCPIINFPTKEALPYVAFQTYKIERIPKKEKIKKAATAKTLTFDVGTETDYRESGAQTDPWEPPYVVVGDGDPEVLKLEFLKWGSGLPAGVREVQLIERARMKAAWEKVIQPNVNDENSLVQFRDYLEALERDEWAFREQEIAEVQELRLQLLENMLDEIHEKSHTRTEMKMNSFIERQNALKEEKLSKIRKQAAREMRKLEAQKRGFNPRYHRVNIIDEHADKKSEIYGPYMRHGEHPKRWHQVIDEKMKQYRAQFIGVENFSTLPGWLEIATKKWRKELSKRTVQKGLCIKETKWTAPVLKELHEELKNLHKDVDERPLALRTKVEIPIPEPATPEIEGVPPEEDKQYQAVVLLQKIIRGRAEQMLIYEGRDTCKELIQELKYSVGLLKKDKGIRSKEKQKVKLQQREESIQLNMVQRLQGMLGKLQGVVVGTLLDFLNKELRRLLEERKAHAMCLVNERERYIREAAEAGRRQKELRRRREHDEMFKQIVKVTQDSVDVYLQDIIAEGMEFASKEEATEYITKLARKIERDTDEAYSKRSEISIDEQDELIADMVHHFVLPDVQKKIVRQRIAAKQKQKLKTVHDTIYTRFETFQKPAPREPEPIDIVTDILNEVQSQAIRIVEEHPEEEPAADITIDKISYGEQTDDVIEHRELHYDEMLEMYLDELAHETNEYQVQDDTAVDDVTAFQLAFEERDSEFPYTSDGLETITEVDDSDVKTGET